MLFVKPLLPQFKCLKLLENNDFRNVPLELTRRDGCTVGLSIFMSLHKEGLVQMLGESKWKILKRGFIPRTKSPTSALTTVPGGLSVLFCFVF